MRSPHLAVQARIELARVCVALADLAGARTLMREIDELFRRRPGLGALAGEVLAVRARVAKQLCSSTRGASALAGAELPLLTLLSTHLPVPEIAEEMSLSRNTVKLSQAVSIYASWAPPHAARPVARSRQLGLLEGMTSRLSSHQGDGTCPGTRWNGARRRGR